MTNKYFLILLIFVFNFVSCSATDTPVPNQKTATGPCVDNGDCVQGYHCVNLFCEDIYHPARKIKSY